MQSFSIGQTISRASTLIGATMGSVGLFIVAVQLVTGVLNFALRGQMVGALGGAQAMADPSAQLAMIQSGWYWATLASSIVLGSLVYAGAVAGLIRAENGLPVSLSDCFVGGLAKFLPVTALVILWVLGIYAGIILLVVPGCILIAMWSVTVPALIAEDTSVVRAFGRSRALTKGSRWKIFLLLTIVVLVLYAGFGVLLALLAVQWSGFGIALVTSLPVQVATGVCGAAFALIISAVLVSIYRELIDLSGEKTSSVFD